MKNFIFKSTDADLQKMFQYLETIQKNVLYVTHQVDFCRRKLMELTVDKRLQTHVDDYYETEAPGPEDKADID